MFRVGLLDGAWTEALAGDLALQGWGKGAAAPLLLSFSSQWEQKKTPRGSTLRRPQWWCPFAMLSFMPDSSVVADVVPSANFGERREGAALDMIVLHYTGMPDAEGAITRLCGAMVGNEAAPTRCCNPSWRTTDFPVTR